MALTTTKSSQEYIGSIAAITSFAVPFKFVSNSHIVAVRTSPLGAQTLLIEGSDYTLTGAGQDNGGTLVLTIGLQTGYTLDISRVTPLQQELQLPTQGQFDPKAIEYTFDKLMMIIQELVSWSGSRGTASQVTLQAYLSDVISQSILRAQLAENAANLAANNALLAQNAVALAQNDADLAQNEAAVAQAMADVRAMLDFSNVPPGTVTAALLAANSVIAGKIASLAVTTDNLAANAVTAAKIAVGTITAAQIAARSIVADRIATGVITANEIAAGTITANELAAGAVTAAKIAAGAITSDILTVGGGQNLLYNPDFSQGYPTAVNGTGGGWGQGGGSGTMQGQLAVNLSAVVANSSFSLNNSSDPKNTDHANTLTLRQLGIVNSAGDYSQIASPTVAVQPGSRYAVSVYAASYRAKTDLAIAWFKSDGSASATAYSYPNYGIGSAVGTAANINNAESVAGDCKTLDRFKRLYVVDAAPSDAAFAQLILRKWDTKSGQTDSYLFLCRAQIEEVGINVTQPGPWSPGAAVIINSSGIAADSLRTNNYAEDGSGYPTAGAKLDHQGTALKVASGNLRIGPAILSNLWFAKQIQAYGYCYTDVNSNLYVGQVSQGFTLTPSVGGTYNGVNSIRITTGFDASAFWCLPVVSPYGYLYNNDVWEVRPIGAPASGTLYVDFRVFDSANNPKNVNQLGASFAFVFLLILVPKTATAVHTQFI